jgi:SAM-dependent methyltransferase
MTTYRPPASAEKTRVANVSNVLRPKLSKSLGAGGTAFEAGVVVVRLRPASGDARATARQMYTVCACAPRGRMADPRVYDLALVRDRTRPKTTEIKSYGDYRKLIRNQSSESVRELYDATYYEKHVGDKDLAEAFFASNGLAETPYTALPLELSELEEGQRVLDIGCGRGEIVFQTAARGASAVGVDYADAALEIASATRERNSAEIQSRTSFVQADATKLPFPDASFDRAFLLDVVEHLAPRELLRTLREARRVLAPTGRLVIHTSPNLWTRTYGYHLFRVLAFLARQPRPPHPVVEAYGELDADPDYDPGKLVLHINEQSVLGLKLTLMRAGFRSNVWLQSPGAIFRERPGLAGAALRATYTTFGLKFFFGADIYAVARPARPSAWRGSSYSR